MFKGQIDLICAPVHIALKDYFEIIRKYKLREYKLGQAEAKRLLKMANKQASKHSYKSAQNIPLSAFIKKDNTMDLFGTHAGAEQRMLNNTFTASERTLSRVDNQINSIITEGYRNGKGINDVANSINRRFDQLESWEAKRIARTEIHGAHNTAVYDQYQEDGVEYTQWSSVNDGRTRGTKDSDLADHIKMDGEIIRIGDTYSNGLAYPGDTSGDIWEWINCRCSNKPFVMPLGYMAPPGMEQFREEDLIKIDATPKDINEILEQIETPSMESQNVDINGRNVLTDEQLGKMDFQQLAEHHGAKYEGVEIYDYDGRKYHKFVQTYDHDKPLIIRIEDGAVKSYTKKGIATPNEIINEVFKVPDALKRQTDEIWFKNTNQGIHHTSTKTGYDSLSARVGGYNSFNSRYRMGQLQRDPNHRIVINPKYFKGGGKRKTAFIWERDPNNAREWEMTIYHEFTHSIDKSREAYEKTDEVWGLELSSKEEFVKIHQEEPGFTWYANTQISEAFAEHGGYVSYMLSNPSHQHKKIKVEYRENGELIKKDITFEEYKLMYPKHYEYFIKLFKGEIRCY